jgi:hypothetical protein
MAKKLNRRNFLKKSIVASGAVVGLSSFEEKALLAHEAKKKEIRTDDEKKKPPIKELPCGKIGDIEISRVIIGSNLFGGGAHARNLMYVSQLMKRYFTDEKIIETLQLCEENGINTNIGGVEAVKEYNKEHGGKMQSLAQLDPGHHDWSDDSRTDGKISITKEDIKETVEWAAEQGCLGGHLLGCRGDRWVKIKRFDMLEEYVSLMRKNGMLAGIGAHDLRVPLECKKAGIECDYFFKTIHPDTYWGTLTEEQKRPYLVDSFGPDDYDCMWEQWPEKSIKVMQDVKTPWIGFKVLAAGAVHPKEGFRFAFENGADFVCAGMFDWQVRDNAAIAKDILSNKSIQNRNRKWMG